MTTLRWLCWSYGLRWSREVLVAQRSDNRVDVGDDQPGIILYPSLLTPTLSTPARSRETGGPLARWLELLLLAPEGLSPEQVNRQLEVLSSGDSSTTFGGEALLAPGGVPGDAIFVSRAGSFTDDQALATFGVSPRFEGVLSPHAVRAWRELLMRGDLADALRAALAPFAPAGTAPRVLRVVAHGLAKKLSALSTVYAIRVDRHAIAAPTEATTKPGAPPRVDLQSMLLQLLLRRLHTEDRLTRARVDALPFAGLTPRVVSEIMSDEAGVLSGEQGGAEPMRSLHPWFELDEEPRALRVGHATDLHINARLDLLQRSLARVINGASSPTPSARLAEMISLTTRNVVSVIDGLVHEGANLLLLGGDNIDHVRNAWSPSLLRRPPASVPTREVWDAVAIRNGDDGRYQPYVDFQVFYSVLRRGFVRWGVPAFGVNGNHDFYKDPYGLTPAVAGTYMNEGIPADVNLTPYEARLLFGDTATSIGPNPAVKAAAVVFGQSDQLRWYHCVFCPFSDYVAETQTHPLVAIGWGDEERLFLRHGDRVGNLPTASRSMTDAQLGLLERGLSRGRPAVVLTHFTFASYDDAIARSEGSRAQQVVAERAEQLAVGMMGRNVSYLPTQLGTFDHGRSNTYALCRDPRRVSAVFSGHSHRRGLYWVGPREANHFPVRMGSFDESATSVQEATRAHQVPFPSAPFVVSDSAGPYPRLNREGEFQGWGSARPSGTLADFHTTGGLTSVRAVPAATARPPRLAVALAYREQFGHDDDRGVFERLALVRHHATYLVAELHPRVWAWGVRLRSVALHSAAHRTEARAAPWSAEALWKAFRDDPFFELSVMGNRDWRTVEPDFAETLVERSALWAVELAPDAVAAWSAEGNGRFASFGMTLLARSGEVTSDYDVSSPWDVELALDAVRPVSHFGPWTVQGLTILADPDYNSRPEGGP